jgi:peptide maturation system protein (TIGR04066 family)
MKQFNIIKVNDHNLEIECPVIFVNGITEQLNKLDVIIELAHSLSAKGYKESKIGTRHYCNILDMHPFPQFMFSEMKERQKIQTFRAFALNIYKKERPDVFIIGIPGAAIPYNDKVDNGYGITNFLVSMAVRADFSITCSNLEFWDFEKLNVHFTHRFGHGIDCVVLSNTKILYNIQEFPDKIFYEIQDYTQIDKYKNKIEKENPSIPIYNIFNEKDMGSLTELVINELADVGFFKL